MKFVHAAVSLHPPVGIAEQMAQEAAAARGLGLDWTVWLCKSDELPAGAARLPHALRGALLRLKFFARLIALRRRGARIVLRHSHGDPFEYVASFLLRPFWTVHHTLEEADLASSDHRLAPMLLRLERGLGRRSLRRARGLVCVTGEIARHELSRLPANTQPATYLYPNGVLYADQAVPPRDARRADLVEIVFVASAFFGWHGLDRLLQSLATSKAEVKLHLVGAVPGEFEAATRGDRRIVVHGVLDPVQLDAVLAMSWVGLSSFALDRKRMQEACTLKVREYLRAGLPVYAGHRDAALPAGFPFYLHGPADIEAIAAFARQTRATPRAAVADAARPFIDKQVLLQRLHAALLADAARADDAVVP
jgi:hypothetical protein